METEKYIFGKNEIARRLQLPMERIEILITDCSMPTDDEDAYSLWFSDNSERILEELDKFGPVAIEEANHPVSVALPSDGNLRRSPGI